MKMTKRANRLTKWGIYVKLAVASLHATLAASSEPI